MISSCRGRHLPWDKVFFVIRRYGQSFDMPEDRYDGQHSEKSIRSGPSSDALPVSKVVAYIQSRS